MQEQESQGPFEDKKSSVNWSRLLYEGLIMPVNTVLHTDFGERYFGFEAVLAIPIMLAFVMVFGNYDVRPLVGFMALYIAACFVARMKAMAHRWRGNERIHSRYDGLPRLMKHFPRWKEINVKRLEGFLVLVLGIFLFGLNPPLGAYLTVAAIAVIGSINQRDRFERTRAMDLNDAVHEQTNIAERFRNMRGR